MPRPVTRIDTVEARSKLAPRPAPYWVRLKKGCFLGYRKMTPASPGTWLARIYDPATQADTWRSLGGFDDLPAHARHDAAKEAAEALAKHMAEGGHADVVTVREACAAYVEALQGNGKTAAAKDAAARFARWVNGDALGEVKVRDLKSRHLEDWRRRLARLEVVENPHVPVAVRRTRLRSASALNRDMTAVRAALNHALKYGAVTTDAAWRVALRPVSGADRQRGVYLDRQQRADLIAKAPADVAAFLRALSLVPLRPGALAALTVASLDLRLSTLTVLKDKAGAGRSVVLPAGTLAFFAELARNKLPAAPLLSRADGKPWDKDAWKKPVKAAAAAAGLPASVTAYTLRHSVITDLVGAGLDVLTVARLSGTSVAMIERHYGHLRAQAATAALATLAP